MAKIIIRDDECVGCGACVATTPDVFEIVDGKAQVKKEIKITEELVESAKEAQDMCPVQCIDIED
jgi:ferredoxin